MADLARCDFNLFPKMKIKFNGCRCDTAEEIHLKNQKFLQPLAQKFSGQLLVLAEKFRILCTLPREPTLKEGVAIRILTVYKFFFLKDTFREIWVEPLM